MRMDEFHVNSADISQLGMHPSATDILWSMFRILTILRNKQRNTKRGRYIQKEWRTNICSEELTIAYIYFITF